MFLLYMFVLASYASYIMHKKEMYLFSDTYSGYSSEYGCLHIFQRATEGSPSEYERTLPSYTMSCIANHDTYNAQISKNVLDSLVQIDKSNEEYVDDYVGDNSGDNNIFGGDTGGGGGNSDYFRPEELAKGRFVKNIKYSYRGMDLHPRTISHKEITRNELYQNMEKKRILNTLKSIHVPIPNKLQLCDYVKKQYSDSCAGIYRHNLLGGGLLNDGEWEL